MKYIFILIILSATISFGATDVASKRYTVEHIPENMSVKTKKDRFYYLIVPAVEKVHKELTQEYMKTYKDIVKKENLKNINKLKKFYKVKSDIELLFALKPHPKSITIAQAAIESGWATSRFFVEANNIFGMWSANKNEPRIAASQQRDENRTIWLRKFDSIEDSVRSYYKLLAKGKAYKEFRRARYTRSDVDVIVKKLNKYSELGEVYTQELSKVIKYNKLTKYDK